MIDDFDLTPLKNLPNSGLIVYPVDDELSANNVLSGGFGRFKTATVIGREIDTGDFYFASSHLDYSRIIEDLTNFIKVVENQLENTNG